MHRLRILSLMVLLMALINTAACGSRLELTMTPTREIVNLPTITQSSTPKSILATATPTQRSTRVLSICMNQEPKSLFWYVDTTKAALNVWQAMNDGPFDYLGFEARPVIQERLPSLENGDVTVETIQVNTGDLIMDATGKWASLGEGVSYRPDQCNQPDCVKTYSGSDPVNMASIRVKFQLKNGILWSDGSPLSADDSVYAFEVAKKLYPLFAPEVIAATSSYLATDAVTVEWKGLPGYIPPSYVALFFIPMPRHAWGILAAEDLPTAEISARLPLSWGAYTVEQWVSEDHITLRKNPYYFRSGEGLPIFDRLVFRFVADGEEAIQAILAGECDLVDEVNYTQSQLVRINELSASGKLNLTVQLGTSWEQILFGIFPYPAGRMSKIGSQVVRQAITACIDRSKIIQEAVTGPISLAESYVFPSHPLFNPKLKRYEFDPQKAGEQLTQAGWLDTDNNPATPRTSQGVPNIPDGTPFELTYLTTTDEERQTTAQIVKESLAQCGIKVTIETLSWDTLLAGGPDGPVFGRNFDLAQFGWNISFTPACALFTSAEIPGPYPDFPKGWGGANASGYSNAEFDQACSKATTSLPDSPEYQEAHLLAQAILAEDPAMIPLYWRGKILLTRPDFCGLVADVSSRSSLWNIEVFNYGEDCQKD